jgi:hypothetical protein
VPQPKIYIAGLRGVDRNIDGSFKETNAKKIDLTIDAGISSVEIIQY